MKKIVILFFMVTIIIPLISSTREDALKRLHPKWQTLDPSIRIKAFEKRKSLIMKSPYKSIPFINVGPIAQGGRVMSIAMDERKPATWIVAYATGGVWITRNDGQSWEPIFDREATFSVGALAVTWSTPGIPKTIWVGTGEPSNTRTVYMGTGVYKSNDQGKTWKNVGLINSHHIGKIVIYPGSPEKVFVAALGPVYTSGGQRGVFRTSDGGKTWEHVLKCPEFTGAVDILIDRFNPEIIYASTWERQRKAWDFRESGNGSGIWKSKDGGSTFIKLAGGLPNGAGMGRIGLAQSYQKEGKLYAIIDNQSPRPFSKENPAPLKPAEFLKMRVKSFLKLSDKRINNFLKLYGFPRKFSSKKIRIDHKKKEFNYFKDMKKYVKNQKDIPVFQPKCIGPELYVTNDAGLNWGKTHEADLWNNVDWGYGTATYYFGRIAVDPGDDQKLLICLISLIKTDDGGKTFKYADEKGFNVHADNHIVLYDSKDRNRVLLGNDGGLNISMDGGISWRPVKNIPVGQSYTVTYDMEKPYHIFTGLQDNGIGMGLAKEVKPYDQIDSWKSIWGADGMFIQINPVDNKTAYLGTQFGEISRKDLITSESKRIRPIPEFPKEPPFRTNWVTPIVMSSFHPDIIYTGTQFIHRSFDRGDHWKTISPNLTSEGKKGSFVNVGGNVSYGNISALAESKIRFGLLYAGTDEGWIWVSRDSGLNWKRCTKDIPQNKWVTRIEPSKFEEGTVYATFTGFRENDTEAYLYKSVDYGENWISIKGNLPNECFNVIREDPVNPDLLYAGSDYGVYVTLDSGKRWDALAVNLPNIPAYDICIHPREMDLIIGTYGRSVWVGSVKVLQAYVPKIKKRSIHIFKVDEQQAEYWWEKEKPVQVGHPRKIKPVNIFFHVKNPGIVKIYLKDSKNKIVRTWEIEANYGINRLEWDFLVDKSVRGKLPEGRRPFVKPGTYKMILKKGDESVETIIKIKSAEKRKNIYFSE